MPAEIDPMERFITRQMQGDGAPLEAAIVDDGADAYRAALAAEQAADRGDQDDVDQGEPVAEFDPDALDGFASDAAAALGFPPNVDPQVTTNDRWFEGMEEADRDAAYAAWHRGLTAAEQAAIRANPDFGLESFAAWVEAAPNNQVQAVAAQVPGLRIIEEPLHAPLRRFGR